MADPNTRQGKRTPVTLKIKFKSETLEQFIERYAVDVSQGGIFIRTKEPLAVGTQMKFEFQLRDASPLIAGEGTVVWTRENDPSRPAIAPGMGVRFDRLADGSQTVLEKILSEKAKQAPRAQADQQKARNDAAAAFTDTPTRVAPAAVQSALGLRSRSDSMTPLPGPLPFHSDAEDFDEKAFEEATKVRSLEELAAQSAGLFGEDTQDDDAFGNKHQTAILPPDELAARRQASRDGGDPPLAEPPAERPRSGTNPGVGMPKAVPDRDSAPSLPTPPAVEGARAPRMLDTTPSPQPIQRPSQPVIHEGAAARTSIGVEPARAAVAPAKASAAEPAAEPARPVAPGQGSKAPLVILGLVVVAAAAAAVWWFGLREKVAKDVADRGAGSDKASPDTQNNTPTPTNAGGSDSGSAGSAAVAATGSGDGTGSDATGSGSAVATAGSNVGSAAVTPPAAPTVDTVVASLAKGATIEILGTDQKGPAPFTAKLEKGKTYKARVSAPGYADQEIDVTGGDKANAKLELKPRILSVTSEPAGADIIIDGVNTKKQTPSDVTLTATQAAKQKVRVTLRRAGYRASDQVVEASAFQDGADSMTHAISAKLAVAPVVRPPTNTGGGTDAGAGSASGEGTSGGDGGTSGTSGDGGTTGGTGTTTSGSGGAATGTTTPGGTGTTSPAGGSAAGSATKPSGGAPPATSLGGGTTLKPSEPEPTWTK